MFKRLLYPFLGLRFGQIFAADTFRLEDVGSRIINRLEDSQHLCEVHDPLAKRPKVPRLKYPVVVFQMGAGDVGAIFSSSTTASPPSV